MAKMKASSGVDATRKMNCAEHRSKMTAHGLNLHERGQLANGMTHGMAMDDASRPYIPTGSVSQAAGTRYPEWITNPEQGYSTQALSAMFGHPHKVFGNANSEKKYRLEDHAPGIQGKDTRPVESMLSAAVDSVEAEYESDSDEDCPPKRRKQPKIVSKIVHVGDLEDYLYWMFDALTQKGVKTILHAWISGCHPKKQTLYPYKGNKKKETSPPHPVYHEIYNVGFHTAPDYWPNQDGWWNKDYTACRHLEPYHIYKNERQFLAKHLLLNEFEKTDTQDKYKFDLSSLQRCTSYITDRNASAFPPNANLYLESIYAAAELFKQSQGPNARIDPTTKVKIYMTCQKSLKVKPSGGKRSGHAYFYGPGLAKRREMKVRRARRNRRSRSTSSGSADVKDEATSSSSTSSASSEDEDGSDTATSPTLDMDDAEDSDHSTKKEQVFNKDEAGPSDVLVSICPKDANTQLAPEPHSNNVQHFELWQTNAAQHQGEYLYPSEPSSASSSSSFAAAMTPGSDASGSYSPHAACGYTCDASYLPQAFTDAQAYPYQAMRTMSAPGFLDGAVNGPAIAFAPHQLAWNGYFHGPATAEQMNSYAYRRGSLQYQPAQFMPWGADYARAY